jgi:hypothetical protein
MPPKPVTEVKKGYTIAMDLKAAGSLVPQLKEAGWGAWLHGLKNAAVVMEWQDELLDLSGDYDFDEESPADQINRMVAWLLMLRTIKGHEDVIQEEIDTEEQNFNAAFIQLNKEFNRATTSSMNSLCYALFGMTMQGSQLSVRAFAASLVKKSRKIEELSPGQGFTQLQLLAIFSKGLPSEYKEVVQHINFAKISTLKEAVDVTRDFAVSNFLESEAGVNLAVSAPRKVHQVFSLSGGGGGAQQECKNFSKTGRCRFGTKCKFVHVGNAKNTSAAKSTKNTKKGEPSLKKFEGECFHCGKKGHRKSECHRKLREDAEAEEQKAPQHAPQVFMTKPKRTRHSRRESAPQESESSDEEGAPSGASLFSIANGGDAISRHHEHLYMMHHGSDGDDEVEEIFSSNSSGIRTSARIQAKAWQEAKVHQGAPQSAKSPLQADGIQLENPIEDDEGDSEEDSDDSPDLVPRPETNSNLIDAYVGTYGPFGSHGFQPSDKKGASSGTIDVPITAPIKAKISSAVLAQVPRISKKNGKTALEGFMVLDSASTVFATNDRRNLLPQTIQKSNISVDTGNGELQVQEFGATYVRLCDSDITLYIEKCLVLKKIKIPLILPESYFDVVGCKPVCEGGIRTISKDDKIIIRAELKNKLYRAEIRFMVGRGKPHYFKVHDSGVRCRNYFCEISHHHPLSTLEEGKENGLWRCPKTKGDSYSSLLLSFAANNSTTFASQLLLAHKMFAHLNFKYLRKALGLPPAGENPVCNTCSMVKAKQGALPQVTIKRSARPLHRLHLDIFFSADQLKPWQIVVDDYSRYSWVQQIGTKDKALKHFKRLVEFVEKDKHPWTVAIIRTDAEPVYTSQYWIDYCKSPGSVKQHEVSAPYKHGQNGVAERAIGTLGLNTKSMMIEGGAPNTDFQYAMNFAVFCKNFAPTKANRKYLSPAALYEGNDELKPSSRILEAVLFCLVHVYLYKEERRKHETRSYEAMFMGVDPSHGSFLLKIS